MKFSILALKWTAASCLLMLGAATALRDSGAAGVGFFMTADRVHRLLAYAAAALIGAYIALLFARLS